MKIIDQGTIFYGLRSSKYPEIPCYAIIISARCDIAQNKISKLYYLSAVDAHDWFCTDHGFKCGFAQLITSRRNAFEEAVKKYELNAELLETFDLESVRGVLSSSILGKDQAKAIEAFENLYSLIRVDADIESRRTLVRDLNEPKKTKYVTSFLSDISAGKQYHYHFIPKAAYSNSEDKSSGLIVDLQEIGIMTLEEVKMINSPGIDYQTIMSEAGGNGEIRLSSQELKDKYWLETEDDFVAVEGQLKSPWCELLLQRFALDFIRIGVDGSTVSDYQNLASSIGKEK